MKLTIQILMWSFVGSIAVANPFTLLPGQKVFLYETDFSSSTGWDTSADSFVSHAQAPTFRPPAGGTIAAGTLTMGGAGSALLDLNHASVLNGGIGVGSDSYAVYSRVNFSSAEQVILLMGLGNDEAFAASPTPGDVEIVSGYTRGVSSSLLSWGQKQDFNNPFDSGFPVSNQNGTPSDAFLDGDVFFDVALLVNGGDVSLFTKETTSSTWLSAGGAATPSFSFTANKLALYNPASGGSMTLSDFAISSIPEPGMFGLVLLGGCILLRVFRKRNPFR